MKSYYISNQNQTDVFVSEFAKSINPENIILLNGDLGTGKTYICSKIANYFGIDDLTSSSFQRFNLHRGKINVTAHQPNIQKLAYATSAGWHNYREVD